MYRDPWLNNELPLFRKYMRDIFVYREAVETSGLLPADMVSLADTIWESLTDVKSLNLEVPEGWPYFPVKPYPECSWDGGNFPYSKAHTRECCDFSFYWSLEGKTLLTGGDSLQTFIRLLFMRYSNYIMTVVSRHWDVSVSDTALTREISSTVASALGLSGVRETFTGLFGGNGYYFLPGTAIHSPFSGTLKDFRIERLSGQSVRPERYQVYAVLHTDSGARMLTLTTPIIRREASSLPRGLEAGLLYKIESLSFPEQPSLPPDDVTAVWNGGRTAHRVKTVSEAASVIAVDCKIPADLSLVGSCFSAGDAAASASMLDREDPVFPAVKSLTEDSDSLRAAAAALGWLKGEVFLYDGQYRTPVSGQAGVITHELPVDTLAALVDRSLSAYCKIAQALNACLGGEVTAEISSGSLKRIGDIPPFRIVGVEDPLSGKTAGTGYAVGKSVTGLLYEYGLKIEALRLLKSERQEELVSFIEGSVPDFELKTIEKIYMAVLGTENVPRGGMDYTNAREVKKPEGVSARLSYDRYPERKPVGWYVRPVTGGITAVCLTGDILDVFRSISPNEVYSLDGPGAGVFTALSFSSADDSPLIGLDLRSASALSALKKALVRMGTYTETDTVGGLVGQVTETMLISPGDEGVPVGADRSKIYRRLLYEADTGAGYNRLGVTRRRVEREKALLEGMPAGGSGAFDVEVDCRRLLIPNGGTVWPVSP